jgi:Dolichyl-phosphate-mannose-protein mannosyltransferase
MPTRALREPVFVAWLLAITAAAAALRLNHLSVQILGDDELHLLSAVTTRTLAQLPATVRGNDFGIPLALFFRAWAAFRPLDEWTLRAPMLACGILTPALAALFARRFVSERVALAFAMLVAVHPLFLLYSRFVRPYAICLVLLIGVAWLLDRWAAGRRRRPLWGAALCSALACWCQPLAVIAVALLFGGALIAELLPAAWLSPRAATTPEAAVSASLRATDGPARGRPLALVLGGALALLLTLALFGPALPELFQQFVVGKVGRGTLDREVIARNAAVLAGLPGFLPALVFGALALAGFVLLVRRVGRRALLLLVPAFGQPLVILALQPEGLAGTLVLARYQFYVLPFWMLGAAVALAALARSAAALVGDRRSAPPQPGETHSDATPSRERLAAAGPWTAALFAGALWWFGPVREIDTADNAHAHHTVFQTFEFEDSAGWKAARARAPDAPIHDFYKSLPTFPDPVPLVVEWPAPPDYPHDVLYLNQAFHRLPMKLLSTPGEIWFTSPLLALRNVITLRDGEASPFPPGTLVVLHRNPIVELAWFVYGKRYWQPPDRRHAHDFEEMSRTLRALLGPPVFDDRYLQVFRQPS